MTSLFDASFAIILAGGTGRRMGGASKPDVVVAGRRMLDHVLGGVADFGVPAIVVGPPDLAVPEGVALVREDPPLGGPAAGIAAGFRAALAMPGLSRATRVTILACDAPFAPRALPLLYDACASPAPARSPGSAPDPDLDGATDPDGAVAVTPDGRRQSLLCVVDAGSLGRAIGDLERDGGVHDRSVRALLGGLALTPVDVPAWAMDADTPDDVITLERFSPRP